LHPAPAPSLRNARCSFSIRRNRLLLRLPLPFRTFTSLRIKVPPVPPPVRPASRICPISSRSPQPLSITRASATDHRSWSATFPVACCFCSRIPSPAGSCALRRFLGVGLDFGLTRIPSYLVSFELRITVRFLGVPSPQFR
jgi:hypothetical protein